MNKHVCVCVCVCVYVACVRVLTKMLTGVSCLVTATLCTVRSWWWTWRTSPAPSAWCSAVNSGRWWRRRRRTCFRNAVSRLVATHWHHSGNRLFSKLRSAHDSVSSVCLIRGRSSTTSTCRGSWRYVYTSADPPNHKQLFTFSPQRRQAPPTNHCLHLTEHHRTHLSQTEVCVRSDTQQLWFSWN